MEMNLANVAAQCAKPLCFARKQFGVPNNWCADIARRTGVSRSKRKVSVCSLGENTYQPSGFTFSSTSSPLLPRFEELNPTDMFLRQRIVFLGSQIDEATADFTISQLLLLDAQDSEKEIKLFIYSPGGSSTAAMGIYDAMKMCKADVSTVCLGLAASSAAFLLASGTKGKRFCMPNGKVMLHESTIPYKQPSRLNRAIQGRELKYFQAKMNKTLSWMTGKPKSEIDADVERYFFMNPWEAKEYGIVDEIIDDGKPGLVAPNPDATPPVKVKSGLLAAKLNFEIMPTEHLLLENGSLKSD